MGMKRTQRLLFKALVELCEKHSLTDITISDVTSKCGYRRGVFYYYYKNINDLIISGIISETEERLAPKVGKVPWKEILCESMYHWVEMKALLESICKNRRMSEELFQGYLFSYFKSLVRKNSMDTEIDDMVLHFYAAGILEVHLQWVNTNYEMEPEKLAEIIDGFTPTSLRRIL